MTTRPSAWLETLARVHAEIRDHAWDYRHAGMWLDSMYGEEAIRTRAAGPTPSSARRDQLSSDVAIGVPDVGRDCRVVGLRKAVWDLRRKGEDFDERKSDWPELEARRLLLIVALVTDEDVGMYAARLTRFGGLDWLCTDDEQGGRVTAEADDILSGAGNWPERIEAALTRVRREQQKDPQTRLYVALGALKVVGGYSELFLTLADNRKRLSTFRSDALNALAEAARLRAVGKLRAQKPRRKAMKGTGIPSAFAGIEEMKSVCEAAEKLTMPPEPETSLYILRGLLWDGEEWVARARMAIAEKGASALDTALSPGTMRTSIDLGETLTQMQAVLDRLSVGIGTPDADIRQDAERLATLGAWFGKARDQLGNAMTLNPAQAAPGDEPEARTERLEAPERFRDAAWIRKATDNGLDADLLTKMRKRGKLKRSRSSGGRWLYDVDEVAQMQPTYASLLLDALSDGADFRQPRKAELGRRTRLDKAGQGLTKPDK